MKFLRLAAVFSALALAGCASAPPEKAPEPQRKERIETVRVPVLLKETSYFANGVLDRTITYAYDEDRKLLRERAVREPSRSEPTERTVHEYSGGVLSSTTVLDYEGRIKTKTEFEANAAGQIVRETVKDAKGVAKASFRYEYDLTGLRTGRKVYDGSGALLAVSEYSYSSGRLSVVIPKDATGRPTGRVEHEYDPDGRLLTRTTFDPAGAVSQRDRYSYKNGILAEERTEAGDGKMERRVVYEIGPEGAPVKSTLYDASGRVRDTRIYEHAFRTEERTVVYYE